MRNWWSLTWGGNESLHGWGSSVDLTQSPSTPVFIEFTRPEKAGEMTVIQKDGPDNYRVFIFND
jgi:hypothetical protein